MELFGRISPPISARYSRHNASRQSGELHHRRDLKSSARSTPNAIAMLTIESSVAFTFPRSMSLTKARRVLAAPAKSACDMFEESLSSLILRPRFSLVISWALFRIEGLRLRDGSCGNPCCVSEEADAMGRMPPQPAMFRMFRLRRGAREARIRSCIGCNKADQGFRRTNSPSIYADIDRAKAQMVGLTPTDAFSALQVYLCSPVARQDALTGRDQPVRRRNRPDLGADVYRAIGQRLPCLAEIDLVRFVPNAAFHERALFAQSGRSSANNLEMVGSNPIQDSTPPPQYLVARIRSSVVVFVRNDVVPHIAARETHRRSWKILAVTPKRLLQQYRRKADIRIVP
jgi:hypothetical protein